MRKKTKKGEVKIKRMKVMNKKKKRATMKEKIR